MSPLQLVISGRPFSNTTKLRFLRARKFDVEAAKKMFIECEKWRKEFGVDDLVRNFDYKEKPQVFEYYPQYYHKTDKASQTITGFGACLLTPE